MPPVGYRSAAKMVPVPAEEIAPLGRIGYANSTRTEWLRPRTSAQRQPSFPDLPAIGEIVQGFESTAWFGVFGPANLPADITSKLNATIVAAMTNPGMREQLQNEGAMPVGNSATEFAAFVRDDVQRWAPIVKQSGARPD